MTANSNIKTVIRVDADAATVQRTWSPEAPAQKPVAAPARSFAAGDILLVVALVGAGLLLNLGVVGALVVSATVPTTTAPVETASLMVAATEPDMEPLPESTRDQDPEPVEPSPTPPAPTPDPQVSPPAPVDSDQADRLPQPCDPEPSEPPAMPTWRPPVAESPENAGFGLHPDSDATGVFLKSGYRKFYPGEEVPPGRYQVWFTDDDGRPMQGSREATMGPGDHYDFLCRTTVQDCE